MEDVGESNDALPEDASVASIAANLALEIAQRVAGRLRWTERASIAFQAAGLLCGAALVVVASTFDPIPTGAVMALGLGQLLLSGAQGLFDRLMPIKETVQLAAAGEAISPSETSGFVSRPAPSLAFNQMRLHREKDPEPRNQSSSRAGARIPSVPSSRRIPGIALWPVAPTNRERVLLEKMQQILLQELNEQAIQQDSV